jgi:hypothetical protein
MMGKSTESQRKLSRIAWKIAAVVVTSVSVAWVLWLLMGVWPSVVLHWSEIRPTPLLLGFALALVASYLTFEAFATLVNNLQIAGLPRRELAHLHFTSQLLKHMPGRVWGVGYQWALGGAVGSLGDWLSANLGHMALATFFALWSAAITFGFSLGIVWGVLALVCGGVVYHACWSLVSSPRVTNWLARFSGRIGKLTARIANLFARIPGTVRGRIFLLSVTS